MNCTPMVFREKLRSRKLTVPVLETVGAHEVRLSAEFALGYSALGQAFRARNAHTQLMDLLIRPQEVSTCRVFNLGITEEAFYALR